MSDTQPPTFLQSRNARLQKGGWLGVWHRLVDDLAMEFSANWIMASMLVSTVGGGFFIYGKKQSRLPQLVCGLAIIAESMFVSSILWMFIIAALAVVGLAAAVRAGW